LGTLNCRQEESRLTVLGHAIIEGLDATESVLKGSTSSPWVNPQSPLQYKANEAKMIVNAAPTKTMTLSTSTSGRWDSQG
ncbi:MAG: hypothetical protein QGG39_11840, partial [Candidatus Poribacteria bacterium]|nr:hypothetical protein [Candidatus Poribacteria bacterium]